MHDDISPADLSLQYGFPPQNEEVGILDQPHFAPFPSLAASEIRQNLLNFPGWIADTRRSWDAAEAQLLVATRALPPDESVVAAEEFNTAWWRRKHEYLSNAFQISLVLTARPGNTNGRPTGSAIA